MIKRDATRTGSGRCYCDYAYHVMLLGDVEPPTCWTELASRRSRDGYPTVKIFTTNITPSARPGRMVHFGDIWEVFKVLTAHKAAWA